MEGRQSEDTDEDSFELEPLCLNDAFNECAREEGRRPWGGVRSRRKEARRVRASFFDEEVMGGQEDGEGDEVLPTTRPGRSSGGGQVLNTANDHRDQGDPTGYKVDEDGVVDLCGSPSDDVAKAKDLLETPRARHQSKGSSAQGSSSRLGVSGGGGWVSPAASSSQVVPPRRPTSILVLSSDEEE